MLKINILLQVLLHTYIKKKYPHSKIILIGFSGPNKDYKIYDKHDSNFEQKYYSLNKISNLKYYFLH